MRMKHNLRAEIERQGSNTNQLVIRTGLSAPTVRRYTCPHEYLSAGRLEIWLVLSEALGYKGLDWLMADENEVKNNMVKATVLLDDGEIITFTARTMIEASQFIDRTYYQHAVMVDIEHVADSEMEGAIHG